MTIYLVDLESVETRYTRQWKEHLPLQLRKATVDDVVTISGGETPQATTPGAFLNFGGTNVYKSKQLEKIAELFCDGVIKDGDYFLYTDAWNPTVIQLRYMAELLGVKITIGGLWHAGSYDPQDFLGRLIGNKPWVRLSEQAMFETYDQNFFATDFHIDLFAKSFAGYQSPEVWVSVQEDEEKIVRSGWPMEYLAKELSNFKDLPKRDLILFPHRIAPEKQVEIFRDLALELPQYEFVICQEEELSKQEYHELLGQAKVVFSANLQETLGISWYEGALVDAIPMVPDRLSYTEMALEEFKYPSEWTTEFDAYDHHKELVKSRIVDYVENYNDYSDLVKKQAGNLSIDYFSGNNMYGKIRVG
jgi:glycosyltransferase involved in cell wall biosynthesis